MPSVTSKISSRIESEEEEVKYHFSRSKFGNRVLVIAGYRYKLMKQRGAEQRWVCINTAARCCAFAVTQDDVLVRMTETHTHPRKNEDKL
ncbi:FLYWCH zinc finger domain-containing protein [Phthorimaea operculella]|nr:FLYWCH zinc finger domain-containing protein [Phthorimaea operculella]